MKEAEKSYVPTSLDIEEPMERKATALMARGRNMYRFRNEQIRSVEKRKEEKTEEGSGGTLNSGSL